MDQSVTKNTSKRDKQCSIRFHPAALGTKMKKKHILSDIFFNYIQKNNLNI